MFYRHENFQQMKNFRISFLALAATFFAACSSSSSDEPQTTPDSPSDAATVAATFTANIKAASRASGTSWDANDEIGITAADNSEMAVEGQSGTSLAAPAVILYPQPAATFDLSVTLGGQTFTQKAISINDGALKAGNCYQYTIEISKTALDVKQTSISEWNDVDGGSGMITFQNE